MGTFGTRLLADLEGQICEATRSSQAEMQANVCILARPLLYSFSIAFCQQNDRDIWFFG